MQASFGLKIDGLDRLIADLKKARNVMPTTIGRTVYQFAEEVMGDSKATYVPVDTGALMNTGKVLPPVYNGTRVSVTMGYGDESVGYALIVHEDLGDTKSGTPKNWTRPGSGPKYLETPLKAKQGELPDRIATDLTKVFSSL